MYIAKPFCLSIGLFYSSSLLAVVDGYFNLFLDDIKITHSGFYYFGMRCNWYFPDTFSVTQREGINNTGGYLDIGFGDHADLFESRRAFIFDLNRANAIARKHKWQQKMHFGEFTVIEAITDSPTMAYFRVIHRDKKLKNKEGYSPKVIDFFGYTKEQFWKTVNLCQATYREFDKDVKRYRVDYYCSGEENKDCKTEIKDLLAPLPPELDKYKAKRF